MATKKYKRMALAVLIAVVATAAVFSAGQTDGTAAASGEPVTLSIYMEKPGFAWDKTWGVNPVSKSWIEQSGATLEWIISPDN